MKRFDFDGDSIALDFLNTVSGMRGVESKENLQSWADLAEWARQAKLARTAPHGSQAAYQQAIAIREALHDVIRAAVEQRDPPAPSLAAVNAWIADALAHRHLRPAGGGRFTLEFDRDDAPLAFLRPVAAEAADLLQVHLDLVRICGESEVGRCGWLFLDKTRNHSRRFCSMKDCGNRAKQRRFQQRKRML
ncbi:MAG TPA: ABATE domain-containing protein [Myxococcales bacterium]|nr:ABATE domain-containing protein [Myxococcales bacterium]